MSNDIRELELVLIEDGSTNFICRIKLTKKETKILNELVFELGQDSKRIKAIFRRLIQLEGTS